MGRAAVSGTAVALALSLGQQWPGEPGFPVGDPPSGGLGPRAGRGVCNRMRRGHRVATRRRIEPSTAATIQANNAKAGQTPPWGAFVCAWWPAGTVVWGD